MKFYDWLDGSKEKYIKDLRIDVYRIAIYAVKKKLIEEIFLEQHSGRQLAYLEITSQYC